MFKELTADVQTVFLVVTLALGLAVAVAVPVGIYEVRLAGAHAQMVTACLQAGKPALECRELLR